MLRPITEIKFPDLIAFDRQTFVDEIIARMKMDPNWSTLYDGELYQNASQMVLQFFAYMHEKNATSFNKTIKENFLNQAFSQRAIMNNANQMRINVLQNTESEVGVIGTLDSGYLDQILVIPKYYKLVGYDLNNQPMNFEIISKVDGNYEYLENVLITPGTYAKSNFTLTVYSGTTFSVSNTVTDELLENFYIDVNYTDIIENSIRVYYVTADDRYIELIKTDSFLVSPYVSPTSHDIFPDGVPHYIIRYKDYGKSDILFGSADFGSAFDQTHVGGTIKVFGRYGGGAVANIVPGAIQTTESFELTSLRTVRVSFVNLVSGYGGADRESAETVKQMGPYRYGRNDGHIVDKQDAQTALQSTVIKHEIQTPVFSEISNTVPLLHAHHRIVPTRNFGGFVFPSVLTTDTLNTYLSRFLVALNSFLNVEGAHDSLINDELVGEFVKSYDSSGEEVYNFLYNLEEENPLSGTLLASAWNYKNQLVDSITWVDNYYANDMTLSATSTDHALVSSQLFATIQIVSGKNNYFKFKLNNVDYIFSLELSSGTKTVKEMATELQARIIDKIENDEIPNQAFYANYRTFEYFTYEISDEITGAGVLKLQSPTTGKNSKITIIDNGLGNTDPLTDLYSLLGIEEKIYLSPYGTELVFLPQNIFNLNENEITFLINPSYMTRLIQENYSSEWDHDTSIEDGPIITIPLVDINDPETIEQIQIGTDIEILAYDWVNPSNHALGVEIKDMVLVTDVQNSEDNTVSYPYGTHPIFKNTSLEGNYNYGTGEISLQFINGTLTPLYIQSFPIITKMEIITIDSGTYEPIADPDWDGKIWLEPDSDWHQDMFSLSGPAILLDVTSVGPEHGFEHGLSYEVRIYKQVIGEDEDPVLISQIRFINVDINAGLPIAASAVVESEYDVCKDGSDPIYTPDAKTISIVTADGEEDTESPEYYSQAYPEFQYLTINFYRKSYEYITVDYRPNPYAPSGEAALYLSKLTPTSRRLIGLENIIKNFTFMPIGLELILYVDKNYSVSDAKDAGETALREFYEYSNVNYEHTIGTEISQDLIRETLNYNLLNYGIKSMEFLSGNYAEEMTEAEIADTYFFFLPAEFIQTIADFEADYPNISGLSDLYNLKINAVRKS